MTCNNCDATLTQDQKFCSDCGELTSPKRLKVKSIIGLFLSNFFDFDNKFIKTFKALTVQPEVVIDSYVNGFRKQFVNVISYLGLAVTVIGLQFFVLRRFFPDLLIADSLITSDALQVNNEYFDMNAFFEAFYEYQGLLTVLFIPLYALTSRLLFFDSKKYNLAEHFVINIYTNAHFFIIWFLFTLVTLPLNINYNILSQFAIIPMVVYMTYTFKRLYAIKTFDALARVILYYIIAYVVMIAIALVIAVCYGIYLGYTGQITPMDAT